MQALKNILSTGSTDDTSAHGDQHAGEIAGQGSHFGGAEKPLSSATAGTAPAGTAVTSDTAVLPPRTKTQEEIQSATYTYRSYPLSGSEDSAHSGGLPHVPGEFPVTEGAGSSSTTGSVPNYSAPVTTGNPGQSDLDYGRDTALAGGTAGAATYGLDKAEAGKPVNNTNAAFFAGPQGTAVSSQPTAASSTFDDQRVAAPVSAHKAGLHDAATGGVGGDLGRGSFEPEQKQHSYDKDAALVGGRAAATGAAAYAYEKDKPASAATGTPIINLVNPTSSSKSANSTAAVPPQTTDTTTSSAQEPAGNEHHYGRDAALIGGGAAAAGTGAYALDHHEKGVQAAETGHIGSTGAVSDHPTSTTSQAAPLAAETSNQGTVDSHKGRDTALVGGAAVAGGAAAYELSEREREKLQKQQASQATPTTAETANPETVDSHKGRDAALAGGAAVAGGAAAYELSEKEKEKLQKQQIKEAEQQQKELEKQQKEAQKQQEKQEKEARKTAEKEAAAAAAAAEAEKKRQEKEQKEAAKQREKEQKEAQKQHEKEVAAAAAAAEAEKKEREKAAKKEQEKLQKQHEKEQKEAQKQHEKEVAAAAAAAEAERKEQEKAAKKEQERLQKQQEKEQKEAQKQHEKEVAAAAAAAAETERKEQEKAAKKEQERQQHEAEERAKLQQKEDQRTHEQEVAAAAALAEAERKHHQEEEAAATAGEPSSTTGAPLSTAERERMIENQQRDSAIASDKAAAEERSKKRHSIFGFLHRDKGNKDTTNTDDAAKDGTSHKKEGAAAAGVVGTGAAAYELDKHHEQTGAEAGSGTATGTTAADATTDPLQKDEHSKAPYVAGAAGAGALGAGAYELHKHEQAGQPATGNASSRAGWQYEDTVAPSDTTIGSAAARDRAQKEEHSKTPYVAGAAGAGAVGAGAYELHKHDEAAETQPDSTAAAAADQTAQPTAATQEQKHSKAPYAAGAAGTAAVGTAAYEEHKKDEKEKSADTSDDKSKKRRSILGFLHRDKSKNRDSKDTSRSQSRDAGRSNTVAEEPAQKQTTTAAAAPAAVAAEEERGRETGADNTTEDGDVGVQRRHSKLHKEPPRKVREELEQKAEELRREQEGRHMGTDGEIGSAEAHQDM